MNDAASQAAPTFDLSGGRLSLDFVNTLGGMRGVRPREHLHAYADLVAFARQTGVIDDVRARRLLAEARRRPGAAEATVGEAVTLREALYRILFGRTRGRRPADADLDVVEATLGRALLRRRLRRGVDSWPLDWDPDPGALDAPLWPIVDDAVALLGSGEALSRVRTCGMYEERECSWLFLDESRAGTRRWCSMRDCGNRAKARRHYRKVRQSR